MFQMSNVSMFYFENLISVKIKKIFKRFADSVIFFLLKTMLRLPVVAKLRRQKSKPQDVLELLKKKAL